MASPILNAILSGRRITPDVILAQQRYSAPRQYLDPQDPSVAPRIEDEVAQLEAADRPGAGERILSLLMHLDRPGAAVRNLVVGEPGDALRALAFWREMTPEVQERGTSMLSKLGMEFGNDPLIDAPIIRNVTGQGLAGFGAELVTDPLMYLTSPIFRGARLAGETAQTAKVSTKIGQTLARGEKTLLGLHVPFTKSTTRLMPKAVDDAVFRAVGEVGERMFGAGAKGPMKAIRRSFVKAWEKTVGEKAVKALDGMAGTEASWGTRFGAEAQKKMRVVDNLVEKLDDSAFEGFFGPGKYGKTIPKHERRTLAMTAIRRTWGDLPETVDDVTASAMTDYLVHGKLTEGRGSKIIQRIKTLAPEKLRKAMYDEMYNGAAPWGGLTEGQILAQAQHLGVKMTGREAQKLADAVSALQTMIVGPVAEGVFEVTRAGISRFDNLLARIQQFPEAAELVGGQKARLAEGAESLAHLGAAPIEGDYMPRMLSEGSRRAMRKTKANAALTADAGQHGLNVTAGQAGVHRLSYLNDVAVNEIYRLKSLQKWAPDQVKELASALHIDNIDDILSEFEGLTGIPYQELVDNAALALRKFGPFHKAMSVERIKGHATLIDDLVTAINRGGTNFYDQDIVTVPLRRAASLTAAEARQSTLHGIIGDLATESFDNVKKAQIWRRRQGASASKYAFLSIGENLTDDPARVADTIMRRLSPNLDDYGESIGKIVAVPVEVAEELQHVAKEYASSGPKAWNILDAVVREWKPIAVAGLSFHMRNFASNVVNSVLGGATPQDWAHGTRMTKALYAESDNAAVRAFGEAAAREALPDSLRGMTVSLDNIPEAYRRLIKLPGAAGGTVTINTYGDFAELARSVGVTQGQIASELGVEFFDSVAGKNRGAFVSRGKWNPLNVSRRVGETIETQARATLFAHGLKATNGNAYAALNDYVERYLFGFHKQTKFEREVLSKKIIPFYRWTRYNIPMQVAEIFASPAIYSSTFKGIDTLSLPQEQRVDVNMLDEWMRKRVPVQWGKTDDGFVLTTPMEGWLPMADLAKLAGTGRFFETVMEMSNPAIQLPFEVWQNRSFYFKKPVKEYEGQTRESMFGDVPVRMDYALGKLRPYSELVGARGVLTLARKGKEEGESGLRAAMRATGLKSYKSKPSLTKKRNANRLRDQMIEIARDIRWERSQVQRKGATTSPKLERLLERHAAYQAVIARMLEESTQLEAEGR